MLLERTGIGTFPFPGHLANQAEIFNAIRNLAQFSARSEWDSGPAV